MLFLTTFLLFVVKLLRNSYSYLDPIIQIIITVLHYLIIFLFCFLVTYYHCAHIFSWVSHFFGFLKHSA